jgi:hypothetical protein
MTKLTFDYDTPENNAAVRLARAKLPPAIGNHLSDKKDRALFREGYAAAQAFGMEIGRTEEGMLKLTSPMQQLSILNRSVAPDDPNVAFFAGVIAGAKQMYEAEDEDQEEEEICNTCYMARELYAYMTFRAAREGVGHTLTEEFYRKALHGPNGDTHGAGAVSLFGVTFDEKARLLLDDVQNPEAFAIWTLCDDCYARAHEENREFDAARAAAAA